MLPSTSRVAATFVCATLAVLALLSGMATELLHVAPDGALFVALLFVAYELATTLALLAGGATPEPPRSTAAVSVIVAAWNEEDTILATLRSVLASEDVLLEVIVADDGSTDRTAAVVRDAIASGALLLGPHTLEVSSLAHGGKGTALEAARRRARHPILVTLDADTELGPLAIARIAAPFARPDVEAAAGAVVVRRPTSWLTRWQFTEYAKNTALRLGWSSYGALDQVPGAFAAYRASALERAGGFPTDSLTEDYEVVYRLYDRAARDGRVIAVPTVPSAIAMTEPPRSIAAFVRQRTRWFAGFLITLVRYRHLVGSPRAGAFGMVRLPLKVIDAVLPPIGLVSLVGLVTGLADGRPLVEGLALALVVVRWTVDMTLHTRAQRLLFAHPAELASARPPSLVMRLLAASTETLAYVWLKQLVVLRAYPFALARSSTWERSRPTRDATEPELSAERSPDLGAPVPSAAGSPRASARVRRG